MSDKPLSSVYYPFAADYRSGYELGRRSQRPVNCHVQIVQLPSNALLPQLGQASLAVTLVGSSVANRFASQASAINTEVLDSFVGYYSIFTQSVATPFGHLIRQLRMPRGMATEGVERVKVGQLGLTE